jgi:hypothetical protein
VISNASKEEGRQEDGQEEVLEEEVGSLTCSDDENSSLFGDHVPGTFRDLADPL